MKRFARVVAAVLRSLVLAAGLLVLLAVVGSVLVTLLQPVAEFAGQGEWSLPSATFSAGLLVGWFVRRASHRPEFYVAVGLVAVSMAATWRLGGTVAAVVGLLLGDYAGRSTVVPQPPDRTDRNRDVRENGG